MSILAILLFFIYAWGFGYSVTRFTGRAENFFERNLIDIGIGLGVFSIISVVINLLHIPLNWWLFLVFALIIPIFDIFKNQASLKEIPNHFKLTKTNTYILLTLLIFIFTLYMYEKGSFAYPYLEDDDSWEHGRSIKYISVEKTAYEPMEALTLPGHGLFHYIDPYPPSYGILLAMLHQISPSMNWTLKFFNALIISLSIIFFYFFAREFTNNSQKALIATIILALVPAYMSHFIWSISLSMTLYFVAFYCMQRIKNSWKWLVPTALVIAGILVTQTTTSFKFSIFFGIYWIIRVLLERKINWPLFLSAPAGALLAFLFWWLPMLLKYETFSHLLRGLGQSGVSAIFTPEANRFYTFSTFIFAQSQNMINSPVGIGWILSILTFAGLLYMLIILIPILKNKEQSAKFYYIPIALVWFIISLLMVLGSYLPIRMDYHRSWMLLAFPLAIIAAEAIYFIADQVKRINIPTVIPILILLTGIWFTSGIHKYNHNTSAVWPPGFIWNSMEEIQAYNWLKDNTATNQKVYAICGSADKKLIGFDKLLFSWRNEGAWEYKTLDKAAELSPEDAASYIKARGYDYVIIDADCAKPTYYNGKDTLPNPWGNTTNEKLQAWVSSGRFRPVHQTQGAVIFGVV